MFLALVGLCSFVLHLKLVLVLAITLAIGGSVQEDLWEEGFDSLATLWLRLALLAILLLLFFSWCIYYSMNEPEYNMRTNTFLF